ncbi:hypothetical protein QYF61_020708, partial [Mycteria americana]
MGTTAQVIHECETYAAIMQAKQLKTLCLDYSRPVSSPEVGKPGHGQGRQPAHLTTAPCVNERRQFGCLRAQPRAHWPPAQPDSGSCCEKRVAEASGRAALKQLLFNFLCSHSLVAALCPSEGAGHELLRDTAHLWAETSFFSLLPADLETAVLASTDEDIMT